MYNVGRKTEETTNGNVSTTTVVQAGIYIDMLGTSSRKRKRRRVRLSLRWNYRMKGELGSEGVNNRLQRIQN